MTASMRLEGGDALRRALADLARERAPRAVADALNRTGHELRDAMAREVSAAFDFATKGTERFLARGFAFDRATPRSLALTFRAKPRAEEVLDKQVTGAVLRADGRFAIPVGVKKGARGVPRSRRPRALLSAGKASIPGSHDIIVAKRKRGRGKVLYALAETVKIPKRLDFFGNVEATVRREFPKKAARVLEKRRAGGA